MGADEGYVITDPVFENMDAFGTAYVLSKAIQKIGAYDVVLCGRQSADWGNTQVGSILAEMLGIPVVTIACNIEVADKKLKIKRIVKDGWEVLEAPMPILITVTSEIGLPRLPAGVRIMLANRKQVPVWKAADIGVEMDKAKAHTEVTSLTVPVRKTECELITGTTIAEAAITLAQKISKLL
jgi:electron transfer flavoprotein beta subunit